MVVEDNLDGFMAYACFLEGDFLPFFVPGPVSETKVLKMSLIGVLSGEKVHGST